jgi:hypothetical protein
MAGMKMAITHIMVLVPLFVRFLSSASVPLQLYNTWSTGMNAHFKVSAEMQHHDWRVVLTCNKPVDELQVIFFSVQE